MDTSAHAQETRSLSISTISEDLTITGSVTSQGELHLNGQFKATCAVSRLYSERMHSLRVTSLQRM